MTDAQLDAKGLSCPMPVVKARLALDKLDSGQTLEVLATDPGSKADFSSWTQMSGHELVESGESGGVFRYVIQKG